MLLDSEMRRIKSEMNTPSVVHGLMASPRRVHCGFASMVVVLHLSSSVIVRLRRYSVAAKKKVTAVLIADQKIVLPVRQPLDHPAQV
jgi:predicted solute-binding protein